MSTAYTDFATVRNQQLSLIEDISPSVAAEYRLEAYRGGGFRQWALSNPQACLRRFAIAFLSRRPEEGVCSDAYIRMVNDESELIIAYPHNLSGYGEDEYLDLEEMMLSDAEQVRAALGVTASANYVAGQIRTTAADYYREEQDVVTFLVFPLETRLYVNATGVAYAMQSNTEQSFTVSTTASSDTLAVSIPRPMANANYFVEANVVDTTYNGVEAKELAAGKTASAFTLQFSATLPAGVTVNVYVRGM